MVLTQLISFFFRYRIMRFLFSGGTALLVNLVLLYIFADILHWWYITSSIVAFVGAFVISFSLQKFWTFNNQSLEALHLQVGVSLLVALTNLLLNTLIMYVLVDHVHIYHMFAQIIASGVIACESFFAYKHVIFVARITETSPLSE